MNRQDSEYPENPFKVKVINEPGLIDVIEDLLSLPFPEDPPEVKMLQMLDRVKRET